MRTVSLRLADMQGATIPIGFEGENEYTQVRIDCKKVYSQHPDAVASLNVNDPVGNSYTVVPSIDDTIVVWNVTDSDLQSRGFGELQIVFTVDETVVGRSAVARTVIKRSVPGGGGSGGTRNYNDLENKPQINGTTLVGNKTLENLGVHNAPSGGSTNQVLAKNSVADYDFKWVNQSGGGGGTSDYDDLDNKPSINGVTLSGNKSLSDLDIVPEDVDAKYTKPQGGIPASDIDPSAIPSPTSIIDDNAGEGDTNKVLSADKVTEITDGLKEALGRVTPEQFGAVGDGETDDSEAVQDACDAGYAVYFGDNKTYYLASTVTIDHDVHLFGGKNTVIKTATPVGGSAYDGIKISGTLKKTTTLTTDYTSNGNTDNCNNKFTLTDMDGIEIGDIMVIKATDQHYHYARQYYYLGASLLITDIYDGHLYSCETMPFDITNTKNVSVEIYSAPSVTLENLTFQSSGFDGGNYRYLLFLDECKNSIIKDCTFTQMDNGIRISNCVNVEISNVSLSKCKYDNSLNGDGYGIVIDASTNTSIDRILATCAQHAISITGSLPAINTFIRRCDLTAECRAPGLDTHESTYNLVIEDCTLATAVLNATCIVNRCKVFTNRRAIDSGNTNIAIYGSHNPEWSRVKISNVELNGSGITIIGSDGQNPIQSYNNVFGSIEIENCKGGSLSILANTSTMILSNTINLLSIKNWKDCNEIYNPYSSKIKLMVVEDCTFDHQYFINDHNNAHGIVTSNIEYLDFRQTEPRTHKILVNRDTNGENIVIPKGVTVNVSSANNSAKFRLCGANLVSNNADDYLVGSVSGNDGGTLTRSVASGNSPNVSMNQDGELVYSQGTGTTKYSVYPVGMFRTYGVGTISISAKLVNSGQTSGARFKPGIAIIDRETGLIKSRNLGTEVEATSSGAVASNSREISRDNIVLAYFYCNTAVANSETTFKEYKVRFAPGFAPMTDPNEEDYTADRRTGDGAMTSVNGVNNIMCSEQNFHVSFAADLVNNTI